MIPSFRFYSFFSNFPLKTGLKVGTGTLESCTRPRFFSMVNLFSFLLFEKFFPPYSLTRPTSSSSSDTSRPAIGITYQPPTPPPLCCPLSPPHCPFFLPPPFFYPVHVYLSHFIYGKRLKAQVTIRCDEVRDEGRNSRNVVAIETVRAQ